MIILHPEFLKTINSINELKESIADLLEEKDYLTYYTCRNIEVDYMLKVGFLESKLLELEVKIEKAKKRIKLIESYINEDKPINNEEIENKLSENFSEIESELNEMKKMVNFAFEYCNTDKYEISEDDIKEIRDVYRDVLRKLHPDINPNITPDERRILFQATQYYEERNLKFLRSLKSLCIREKTLEETVEIDELEKLQERKKRYEKIRRNIVRSITCMKNIFPYNQIEFLKDENEVRKKKDEINQEIESFNKIYAELKKIEEEIQKEGK